MGTITEVLNPFLQRFTSFEARPITGSTILDWLGGKPTATGVQINQDNSLQISAVWDAVSMIAADIASLPCSMYRRLQPRGREIAPDHPLHVILHDVSNPFMTAFQVREALLGHVLLWGNAYGEIERDRNGRVVALWPLRPDRMTEPKLSKAGTLIYKYQLPDGTTTEFAQSQIFHLRGLSSNGLTGYSPITMHRETLGWAVATKEYGARFFGNNARPGGILQTPNRLREESAKRLKQSWEEAHMGLSMAHRVAVLEEGVEWKQVGMPNEDAQFLETVKFQRVEIASIFHVPAHKINELDRATFSNIEEQDIDYVKTTLRPWCVRFEKQVALDMLLPEERRVFYPEHNMDALLRGKTLERYQGYQALIGSALASPNELREKENQNPYDGGDRYYINQTLVATDLLDALLTAKIAPPASAARQVIRKDDGSYEIREIDAELAISS